MLYITSHQANVKQNHHEMPTTSHPLGWLDSKKTNKMKVKSAGEDVEETDWSPHTLLTGV